MTTDRAAGGGLVPARQSSRVARVGATIQFALGAGFGIGAAATLAYFARNGELPMTPWGFRSMSGPFERLGPTAFARLGWGLVGVCALDVVAARWLWQGRRRGLRLGLATAPPALVLGAGFALPFLLVGVPIRIL
ncbi:MAG TPA: hypothetical protein VIV06_06685, partial [Candidatus Limnocylindrales bacterium]